MNNMNETKFTVNETNRWPSIFVYTVTVVWLVLGICYSHSNWQKIYGLEPNEFGDMLAGYFAPLAFLWLVAGYLQQGNELKQNTTALLLQHQELKSSVEQQKLLVMAAQEEAEILKRQVEDQLKKDVLRVQPQFFVHGGQLNHDFSELKLTIYNDGHSCQLLEINAAPDSHQLVCKASEKGHIKSEGSFELRLSNPDPRGFDNSQVVLKYRDGYNNTRLATLTVYYDQGDWKGYFYY